MPRTAPQRGDAIWLDFGPEIGHEQAGRRPGIVVSPGDYNALTGMAVTCPITSRVKGYPFEVHLPSGLPVTGVVQADHLRTIDWRVRKLSKICPLPPEFVSDVLERIALLVTEE
jgi:mRNA interferase MazF